jgi:predicted GNAT family acetyltransferase
VSALLRGSIVLVTETQQTVVDNPDAERFEVLLDGAVVGFAEYRRTGSTVDFTHTVVNPDQRGTGAGSALAAAALDASRDAGLDVLPYCSFIRGYIKEHREYLALVPAARRAEFGLDSGAAGGGD